jgi:hypothetical protein
MPLDACVIFTSVWPVPRLSARRRETAASLVRMAPSTARPLSAGNAADGNSNWHGPGNWMGLCGTCGRASPRRCVLVGVGNKQGSSEAINDRTEARP